MKKLLLFAASLFGAATVASADTLVLWNFNSPAADETVTTGTLEPTVGTGTFRAVGSPTNSFGQATNTATSTSSSDTNGDNSGLRLGQFPAQGTANKTAGVEFFTSTVGFESIKVIFDQQNSATASRYWRAQYTTNGTTWIDYVVLESAGPALTTTWINNRIIDFSTVAGVKNNPNFGFRYVSEFISTATGSGADSYLGNSGNYGTAGTLWLDMVQVTGNVLDLSNTDPTITAISNQVARVNQTVGPLSFTIGDAETPAANLALALEVANPGLFSSTSFGGSGNNRTLTLVPNPNQSGSSSVTVTVTDAGGKGASTIFNVVLVAPEVLVSNVTMRVSTSRTVPINISQIAAFQGPITVSADAVDQTLLPSGSLVITGSGSNRNLTITPAANEMGPAIVTVNATDGSLTASRTLFLNVVPSNTVAFWDFNSELRDFNVTTGTTNSNIGNGVAVPLIAVGSLGTVGITSDLDGEDNSRLRLGTFPVQGTSNKLGGVEFRFSTVGYEDIEFSWEHYNSASASRYWRVQYSTDGVNFTDALGYSNLTVTTFFPMSTSFTNVSRADNNPNFAVRIVSEFESTAVEGSTNGYVGVQASGNYSTAGTLWLDTIKFTGNPFTGVNPATLRAVLVGNDIQISWDTATPGTLQGTPSLTNPDWLNVIQTPVTQGNRQVVTIPATLPMRFFRLSQ